MMGVNGLTSEERDRLAEIGLKAEIERLQACLNSLRAPAPLTSPKIETTARKKRKPMSMAERKRVAARMKAFWAQRRKAKEKGAGA